MARIRVALRHLYRQGLPRPQSVYRVGGLELDVEKHAASLDGEPLHLTPMEFSLMSLLMKNAGKVLTSSYLLKEVWGVSYDSDKMCIRDRFILLSLWRWRFRWEHISEGLWTAGRYSCPPSAVPAKG